MSEYQYYEWVAVDRLLSGDEMGYLRGISSRAQAKPDYASIHRETLIDEYVKPLSAATAKTQLKALLLDETGTVRREQLSTLIEQAQEVPQSSSVTVGHLLASARELQKKAHEEAVEQKQQQEQ